jgi:hypothetical protein
MTMAEVERLRLASPRWIVTGRAALWPPLYQAIRRTLSRQAAANGNLPREVPFDPDTMKKAVLSGAIALAQQPHLDLGAEVLNPLAVVTYAGPGESARPETWFDMPNIKSVKYIAESGLPEGTLSVRARGRFAIVRALPGLDDDERRDRRIQLFRVMGIPPWISIGEDVFPAGPATAGHNDYTLHWLRRGGKIFIKIIDPGAAEILGIGPIEEGGRIYGDF